MNLLICFPAFNECGYIRSLVLRAKQFGNVTVLDDGSTDDTAWEAMGAGADIVYHDANKGYGVAIQSILAHARKEKPEVLVIMDADDQHFPSDILALVKAIYDGYDLAIGSRKGSDVPAYRRLGGTVLSIFTGILSGHYVKDSQCGFRAYSKRAVEQLDLKETGMAVSSEIISEAAKHRLKIVEVPIAVRYTADSSTHNPIKQGFYTLWRVLVMIARMIVRRILRNG